MILPSVLILLVVSGRGYPQEYEFPPLSELLKDRDDQSPFRNIFTAAMKGTVQDVKYHLDNGASVRAKGTIGTTPLHEAAGNKDIEVAKFLVDKGAEVNAKDNLGNTPLHDAAERNNVKVARFLVSRKANIDSRNNDGWTPRDSAAQDSPDVYKYFSSISAPAGSRQAQEQREENRRRFEEERKKQQEKWDREAADAKKKIAELEAEQDRIHQFKLDQIKRNEPNLGGFVQPKEITVSNGGGAYERRTDDVYRPTGSGTRHEYIEVEGDTYKWNGYEYRRILQK